MARRLWLLAAVAAVFSVLPTTSGAQAPSTYAVGGSVSVKRVGPNPAAVDDGAVVCSASTLQGIGGACVPFDRERPFVEVIDDAYDRFVPFVVCIDNDGDGGCNPHHPGPCADDAYGSHDGGWVSDERNATAFFNPIGPLPTAFRKGCPGGPFDGYVVFICQGVHAGAPLPDPETGRAARAERPAVEVNAEASDLHGATTGTAAAVRAEPSGYGDLCLTPASVKRYVVLP